MFAKKENQLIGSSKTVSKILKQDIVPPVLSRTAIMKTTFKYGQQRNNKTNITKEQIKMAKDLYDMIDLLNKTRK